MELLGQGSTLEQITKIAKNLLSMSNGGAGNSELFSAVSKVMGSGPVDAGSKLTSSAVLKPTSSITAQSGDTTPINGTISQIQTLFPSLNGNTKNNSVIETSNNNSTNTETLSAVNS